MSLEDIVFLVCIHFLMVVFNKIGFSRLGRFDFGQSLFFSQG